MIVFFFFFKKIRNRRGKTQAETAEYLGFKSLRGYQMYEEGKNEPNLTRLVALADFFDVTTDYLLGRTDKE